MKSANELWRSLRNIPVNENDCIEEKFENFEPGTHREEIWLWIESEFNVRVIDLMFPELPKTKD